MFLVDVLRDRAIISDEDVPIRPSDQVEDDFLVKALVEKGRVTPIQVASARAHKLRMPFVDFSDFVIDKNALALIPSELCRRHGVLPLRVEQGQLFVAMLNSGDVVALDDLRAASGLPIRPVIAERSDLRNAIQTNFRFDEQLSDLGTVLAETQAIILDDDQEIAANDAPIVRFVNLLISQAIADNASDIHIEPSEKDLRIRYRIDGVLHEMQRESKKIQAGVISRIKIMSDIDIAERRKPQDGRMTFGSAGESRDLRVATLPTVWGENIVLRILDNGQLSHSIENLGLRAENLKLYRKALEKTNGMILVTGPTGSGKSTTLYATLSAISTPEVNIITVEDPVEYRMTDINQIQVNPRAGLTFASALRSILRADPDIVLVGEIRDRETAQIALEASLTGHMVLSTLHTNDAPSSLTRMIELGVEPYLVASSVTAVVAQRLARRLCERCKMATDLDVGVLNSLGVHEADYSQATFFKPIGCPRCAKTGYKGRIAIHEVMTITEEIRTQTMHHASSTEIAATAEGDGMVRLLEDGIRKAALGLTTIEEVLRVVG